MKEIFIAYALSMLGTPYKWGGNCPLDGLDCSGFVIECLRSVGENPKHDSTSQQLFNYLTLKQKYSYYGHQPKRGDILFFGRDIEDVTHIAIALDSKHMVEAGGGNSRTKTLDDAIKQNAMVRVRPIDLRNDLITAVRIF